MENKSGSIKSKEKDTYNNTFTDKMSEKSKEGGKAENPTKPFPAKLDQQNSSGNTSQSETQTGPEWSKEYYYYYHSLKNPDPTLLKPKWKPEFYGTSTFGEVISKEKIQEEDINNNDKNKVFSHHTELKRPYEDRGVTQSRRNVNRFGQNRDTGYGYGNMNKYQNNRYANHHQSYQNRNVQNEFQPYNQREYPQNTNRENYGYSYNNPQQEMVQMQNYRNYVDSYANAQMPRDQRNYFSYERNNFPQYTNYPDQQYQEANYYKGYDNDFENINITEEMLADIQEYCKDYKYSKIIQQHFEKAQSQERDKIIKKITPHAVSLIQDKHGNYVIQKILEIGTDKQRSAIYEQMNEKIILLSKDFFGNRVLQKVIEQEANEDIQDQILSEVENNLIELLEDQNGCHVVQKLIEKRSTKKLQFIVSNISLQVQKVGCNAYGSKVVQTILARCPREMLDGMIKKIIGDLLKFCTCQYGNYVIQLILEKKLISDKNQLLSILKDNFMTLARDKFASHVIEKSLIYGTSDYLREIVDLMVAFNENNQPNIFLLMPDPFGNYCVKKLFQCCDKELKVRIRKAVKEGDLTDIAHSREAESISKKTAKRY